MISKKTMKIISLAAAMTVTTGLAQNRIIKGVYASEGEEGTKSSSDNIEIEEGHKNIFDETEEDLKTTLDKNITKDSNEEDVKRILQDYQYSQTTGAGVTIRARYIEDSFSKNEEGCKFNASIYNKDNINEKREINYTKTYETNSTLMLASEILDDPTPKTNWTTDNDLDADNKVVINNIKFKLISNKEVAVTGVGDRSASDEELILPEQITCKGKTYDVTEIKSGAFIECKKYNYIEIPDSVKIIEDNAFLNCCDKDGNGLTSIKIGKGVTKIGQPFCKDCNVLDKIEVVGENTNYEANDGVLYRKVDGNKIIVRYPCKKEGNTYEIPDEVTMIDKNAFDNCNNLENIKISGNVSIILENAFSNCPASIEVSEDNKTYSDMEGVLFTKDNQKLIRYPKDKTVENYSIPNGVKSIGDYAFYNCKNLRSIKIPDGVERIGNDAFSNCESLDSIEIPASVKSIGDSAFDGCENLCSVTIPDGVKSIGDYAFYNCKKLESIKIPASVKSIEESAFDGCENLCSVTIPDGVERIGKCAFNNCKSLDSIEIPDSVKSIEADSFTQCDSIKTVFIENGIKDEIIKNIKAPCIIKYNKSKDIKDKKDITEIYLTETYLTKNLTEITIPEKFKCENIKTVFIYNTNSYIIDKIKNTDDSKIAEVIKEKINSNEIEKIIKSEINSETNENIAFAIKYIINNKSDSLMAEIIRSVLDKDTDHDDEITEMDTNEMAEFIKNNCGKVIETIKNKTKNKTDSEIAGLIKSQISSDKKDGVDENEVMNNTFVSERVDSLRRMAANDSQIANIIGMPKLKVENQEDKKIQAKNTIYYHIYQEFSDILQIEQIILKDADSEIKIPAEINGEEVLYVGRSLTSNKSVTVEGKKGWSLVASILKDMSSGVDYSVKYNDGLTEYNNLRDSLNKKCDEYSYYEKNKYKYTNASFTDLETAVKDAKKVLDNVEKAEAEQKEADTPELAKAKELIKKLKNLPDDGVYKTYNSDTLLYLANLDNSYYKDIETAYRNLNVAEAQLKEKEQIQIDLECEIKECYNILNSDSDKYTAQSLSVLKYVFEYAEKILKKSENGTSEININGNYYIDNENTSSTEMQMIYEDLKSAEALLKPSSGGSGSSGSGSSSSGGSGSSGSGSSSSEGSGSSGSGSSSSEGSGSSGSGSSSSSHHHSSSSGSGSGSSSSDNSNSIIFVDGNSAKPVILSKETYGNTVVGNNLTGAGLTAANITSLYEINDDGFKGNVANLSSTEKNADGTESTYNYVYVKCDSCDTSKTIKINVSAFKDNAPAYVYKTDELGDITLVQAVDSYALSSNKDYVEISPEAGAKYIVTDKKLAEKNTAQNTASNAFKEGWNKIGSSWMFIKNGQAVTGWLKDSDGKWYYMSSDGIMQTGWVKDSEKWYNLSNSGAMNIGWLKDVDGKWYMLSNSGAMVTGWFKDADEKWYYLNSDGSMAAGTTIDGYEVGNDGAWIK